MKHVHAELMKQYAEDAMTTGTPWKMWQILLSEWNHCISNPEWNIGTEYRRKPQIIEINGLDVPTPYFGEIEKGRAVYSPHLHYKSDFEYRVWKGNKECLRMRDHGLIHLNAVNAVLHSQALLSFTRVK